MKRTVTAAFILIAILLATTAIAAGIITPTPEKQLGTILAPPTGIGNTASMNPALLAGQHRQAEASFGRASLLNTGYKTQYQPVSASGKWGTLQVEHFTATAGDESFEMVEPEVRGGGPSTSIASSFSSDTESLSVAYAKQLGQWGLGGRYVPHDVTNTTNNTSGSDYMGTFSSSFAMRDKTFAEFQAGTTYTTKNWQFGTAVGREIGTTFIDSQSFSDYSSYSTRGGGPDEGDPGEGDYFSQQFSIPYRFTTFLVSGQYQFKSTTLCAGWQNVRIVEKIPEFGNAVNNTARMFGSIKQKVGNLDLNIGLLKGGQAYYAAYEGRAWFGSFTWSKGIYNSLLGDFAPTSSAWNANLGLRF